MTNPILATTDINTGDRVYVLADKKYIGVTSILSMLPKQRWLIPWAANCAAERAIDYMHSVLDSPDDVDDGDTAAVKKWIANARADELEVAREHGDQSHDLLDYLMGSIDPVAGFYALWSDMLNEGQRTVDEHVAYFQKVKHFVDWYDENRDDVEVIENECTVFNMELGYAGTCDLVLRVKDELWYCDFKSGKSLHFDAALQLMAYRNGNVIAKISDATGNPDLDKMPHNRKGLDTLPIRNVAIHLMKTKVKFVETEHKDSLWEIFKSLLTIKKEMGYTEIGDVSNKIAEHKGGKLVTK